MYRGIIKTTVSDSELLLAGATGRNEAFGELFERHRRYLWSVALNTTGDPDDADDALQDALVNIVRTASSFRCDSSVVVWMHRVVVNSCFDRLRRRKHHDGPPLPESDDSLPDRVRTDFTDSVDLRLAIGHALDVLPPGQRQAVVAVDVEGRSVTETAALLGIPTGTVKSRCARGRAKLKLVLGHLQDVD